MKSDYQTNPKFSLNLLKNLTIDAWFELLSKKGNRNIVSIYKWNQDINKLQWIKV